ncbi:MAG: tRNA (adenosine(37)-N6)-dimethylallyltransferase MiaA [Prevotellaceae bacterium]|jgi:tRNA dimethylallyltransferase|nr:tRNA (adenosine(37)-N6)-dimethylallyltransferase MiaA [Prevotellaceae bacterium]
MYELIAVTGPTASGKTAVACALAARLQSAVISADSRQVYRGMDIGTGKDLDEYVVDGQHVPYFLIDICDAGTHYNIFQYQHDFHKVFSDLKAKNIVPVLCGGSGLYIEAVLRGYRLPEVPENAELRKSLGSKSLEELTKLLSSYGNMHNTTDVDSVQRAIRAIEIAEFSQKNQLQSNEFQPVNALIIGIDTERTLRRAKITQRLKQRLENGMIEEIKNMLTNGLAPADLIYYGLEYKYVTQFVTGKISYSEMFSQLEIAIHQFAKRQMTWFRGMERRGLKINWIDAQIALNEKVDIIISKFKNQIG